MCWCRETFSLQRASFSTVQFTMTLLPPVPQTFVLQAEYKVYIMYEEWQKNMWTGDRWALFYTQTNSELQNKFCSLPYFHLLSIPPSDTYGGPFLHSSSSSFFSFCLAEFGVSCCFAVLSVQVRQHFTEVLIQMQSLPSVSILNQLETSPETSHAFSPTVVFWLISQVKWLLWLFCLLFFSAEHSCRAISKSFYSFGRIVPLLSNSHSFSLSPPTPIPSSPSLPPSLWLKFRLKPVWHWSVYKVVEVYAVWVELHRIQGEEEGF